MKMQILTWGKLCYGMNINISINMKTLLLVVFGVMNIAASYSSKLLFKSSFAQGECMFC